MKERPILFSAPMVRAILDGSNTQTRRIVKPQPDVLHWQDIQRMHGTTPEGRKFGDWREFRVVGPDWPDSRDDSFWCPYGQPGDRLWVRETWSMDPCPTMPFKGPRSPDGGEVMYRATDGWNGPWIPSIHMFRWASRITLEVTGVRVERLQDITSADILAEGIRIPVCAESGNTLVDISTPNGPSALLTREQFGDVDALLRAHWAALWCEINGRASWDANPWVWVVEFNRVDPA